MNTSLKKPIQRQYDDRQYDRMLAVFDAYEHKQASLGDLVTTLLSLIRLVSVSIHRDRLLRQWSVLEDAYLVGLDEDPPGTFDHHAVGRAICQLRAVIRLQSQSF